jgi:hypothetical protein
VNTDQRSLIIHSYAPGSSADSEVAAHDMHASLTMHEEQAGSARMSRESAIGGDGMLRDQRTTTALMLTDQRPRAGSLEGAYLLKQRARVAAER